MIRYIRYMCKSAYRIVSENMCWSLISRGWMLVSAHRIVCENMWCVYVTLCSNQLSVCVFKIWFYIYIYIYMCVCVCVCSVVPYMFGKLCRIFWVKLWNQTRALLDSILLYIMYNCLLDVWLTPSITIFRLKFSWGTKPVDYFVRCKVERGSCRQR